MKRTTKHVALDVHQATTVASVREESGRVIARTSRSGAPPSPIIWTSRVTAASSRSLRRAPPARRTFGSATRASAARAGLPICHPAVSRLPLGPSRLVEWVGPGGQRLQGALLLPAGYMSGKPYPLVVKVYGGSLLSGRVNRFGLESGIDNLQLLATRGYAVLLPDTPLDEGRPMADLAADVLPGVDSVVPMGVADSTRLAVMGHSYGGIRRSPSQCGRAACAR